jgi:hypothetical protein
MEGIMKFKTRTRKKKLWEANLPKVNPSIDYPWKVLGKLCLDLNEYLTEDESRRLTLIIRNRDLDGYLELSEEWGLQSTVTTDSSLAVMRAKYLLASLVKKFPFSTDKDERIARATEIFFDAESKCKTYNDYSYKYLSVPETEWGVKILHYARLFLTKLLGVQKPGHLELLDRSRHGPGATIGTVKGNTSLYHKYEGWPYTCTIDAYRYARFAIETDQRWIGALQNSYRERFGIQKHELLDMQTFWSKVIKVVDGNRITFVPKDARKERTIAIEPTLNIYLQLGVDGYIRKRLKRYGVNLDSQSKNQELARLGSLSDGIDSFVTVDLSSASDSVSKALIKLLLPEHWYSYLMDLRSPTGDLNGDLIEFEKVSSMGNGYTFALESAIFTALVYAVTRAGGGIFDHSKFAVFGDDIIVERRWYYQLVEALRLSGFSLNLEKTFSYGPIRESCGTDWFRGKAVRPVFLDKIPTKAGELFCDYNRIKRLLSLRWSIEESDTLDFIRKLLPEKAQNLIGPLSDEDFDSYIHTDAPRPGMYKRGLYKFKRVVQLPRVQAGDDFFFRKLMHSLKGKPILPNSWEKKLPASGSRFTVTSRNAIAVCYTYSLTSIWSEQYYEYRPPQVFSGRR